MSTLFLIGTVAVVLGAIALAADGALDFLPDSEWFSLTGIAAGVAMFCFVAGTLEAFGLGFPIAAVLGGAAGLGVLVGTSLLIYRLRNTADSPDSSLAALVGSTGTVITAIPAGGIGEVDVRHQGERHRLNAVSDDEVPTAGQVTVIAVASPTCVRVQHLR